MPTQYIDAEGDMIPENLAVITTENIMNSSAFIQLVVRDYEAEWQFLPDIDDISKEIPLVVAIHRIISLDPSITNVLQLGCGKRAWRAEIGGNWVISEYKG